MAEYTFTNGKDARKFAAATGGPVDIDVQNIARGNWIVTITERDAQPLAAADMWEELSTDDAADMSEVFAAQEEADALAEQEAIEPVADEPVVPEAEARILRMLEHARDAGNRAERKEYIKEARALGISGARVAEAAGVSITYAYDVANGHHDGTKPALREYQKGYQSALADIAAVMATSGGGTSLAAAVGRWITDNRMSAAESIFAQALAEHTAA